MPSNPFFAALLISISAHASPCGPVGLASFSEQVGSRHVTFVARDLRRSTCWETSRKAAETRHAPWSTSKIPHFLITLATSAVTSAEVESRWDPAKHPPADYWPSAWRRSQSLRSAFERSAAWYFQDLVPRIGPANYRKWLNGFGNREVPLGRDDRWLGGPLEISPWEQARFLACVANTGCGASSNVVRLLGAAALVDESSDGRMFGKTGSGPVLPGAPGP